MEVVPDSLTLHSTVSGPVFQQQFFCLYWIFFSDEKEPLGSNLGMEQIDLFSINGRKETHPSFPPEKKTKNQQQNKLKHENKETKQN